MSERTTHYGQKLLALDSKHTEHLILAGVRYGKSFFGPLWHFYRVKKNAAQGAKLSLVVAPNYKLAKQVCLSYYKNFLISSGLKEGRHFKINKSDLAIFFPTLDHTVLTLSGETPERIIAYTSSHAWNDEAASSCVEVRNNILQRNSFNCTYQQTLHTTTPIGTDNWLYDVFGPHKVPRIEGTPHSISERESKIVLHGKTHDNPYLSQRYLDTLERELSWNQNYYLNYVCGEWVDLSQKRFYFAFDQSAHTGDFTPQLATKDLYFSFDNNVGKLAWVAGQPLQNVEKGLAIVEANKSDAYNVQHACEQIIAAFPPDKWRNHRISIYGDAVLWDRSNVTYTTAFDIIKSTLRAKYSQVEVRAKRRNPFITDRSLCTNTFFGQNRLVINKTCSAVILSARTAQMGRDGKIKKPSNDDVTHPMECVDRLTMALDPIRATITELDD